MILHVLRQVAPYPNNSLAQGARKLIHSHVGSWIGGWHFCYSRRRTPAPPLLPAAMNFTPASSSALRMASSVRGKSSSPRSKRVTVFIETFAAAASSRTPICTAARAVLHCAGVNSPLALAGILFDHGAHLCLDYISKPC